jgi:hypothetical protein
VSAEPLPEHLPGRPSWGCLTCGKAWPCEPARGLMAAEMDVVQLSVYGWITLEQAAADLPDLPVAEMFDRFLRWTR